MTKQNNPNWERIERVIRCSGMTINSFAKELGLPRGENLYQIKRGNNGVSRDVAKRIHEKYPQYSVVWLMFGKEQAALMSGGQTQVVSIPICRDWWTGEVPVAIQDNPDDALIISAAVANGAEVAVPYMDDILNPYLRHSLMLLRKCKLDEVVYGNIYFVATEKFRLFRIVGRDQNPDVLRLKTLLPSIYNDIVIGRDSICSLWVVCGAVCRMGQ